MNESANQSERQTYTVREAAVRLGIAPSTTWKHIASGTIPVLRLGGRTLVRRTTVERLLAEPEGAQAMSGRVRAAEATPKSAGPRLLRESGSSATQG